MNLVPIRHPDAGETEVPESAVPHWQAAGWEPYEKPKPAPKLAAKKAKPDKKEGE